MIIVSGASRGLGKAIKDHLVAQGREVYGLARQDDVSQGIYCCDVSNYKSVKTVVAAIKKEKKKVFAFIHAAGIASMNLAVMTPEKVSRHLIETNLLGTIFSNQLFAPLIMSTGGGRIINFSTIAVALGLKGESIYVASKAGVEGFTRSFAREIADFGITANCIAPGPIKTDLLTGVTEQQINKITDQQIFTKTLYPTDVVNVVDMLLSENSKHISGQVFHVGGV